MQLPIRFPTDTDVIADEAARFRALSSDQRLEVLRGILDAGWLMLRDSPHREFADKCAEEQERAAHGAIQEFVARHGH
jgi:hypothetical protein